MNSVLVIGGGIAGQAVCEAVRERDPHVAITLVCGEPHKPYDRVRLGALLSEDGDVEELRLRPDSWYEDAHIDVRTGVRVASLDPQAGTATLNDMHHTVLRFDRAVLCTGSDALVPPMQNQDAAGVHVFRDPADCEAIVAAARLTASRAAVIGGGLLGLEAAYALAQLGTPTTVIHLVDRLMERQLDAPAAALLRPAIEELGVEIRLEHATRAIRSDVDGKVTGLLFADGSDLDCDLVVVAVGIRPHVGLARAAGLEVDRGIVVDDGMVTSAPNVLAVGECAQHRGIVHGIVAPIHDQAKVAGQTITGGAAAYAGSIPTAKLKVMGIDLVTAGAAEGEREVVVADAAAGTYRKLVTAPDGTVRGAVLVGDARGAELLIDAVRTERVTEDALALLAEASQATAAELPDAAQVCNCNGVCKGEIVEAIRERGLGSTQEVVNVTRAGAGCGSCKPVVTELLQIERAGAAEEPAYLCPCRRQTREQLAAVVREQEITSVSELSNACGAGRDCGACKPGLSYLIEERQAGKFRQERHAKFINDRVHANIQNDGTFSVVPRIRGGVVTSDELRRFADVADKYELPMIKITGGQRIDLLGAKKEQLPAIWEDLGMPSGYAYSKAVRTVKTCVGETFCRFGLGDSINVGIDFERAMEGLHTPHKVKAAVTGCPRNCAEAYVKDIGLVAVEGGWEIYVGGAAGASVRKGDLLAKVQTPEEAKRIALAYLQYYREHGEHLERTYGFQERVGLEQVQADVLDPDTQAALLERFAIAKAACDPDPWRERIDPVHPKQFAELDTDAEFDLVRLAESVR
ncbi:MAG TPA: nitrite reductase large subunit NirB [Solirubrobacteraceae bacterium]